MLAVALLAWAGGVELEDLRVGEVNDLVEELTAGGAEVNFYVHHAPTADRSGTAKTGALAMAAIGSGGTVLRVPEKQVFSLASVPGVIRRASQRQSCDAHAMLALGVVNEKRDPNSRLYNWLRLLPRGFANVLYYDDLQLALVARTYFSYLVETWPADLACMNHVVADLPEETWGLHQMLGPPLEPELRWALSVVKTRAFAVREERESTLLIPAADFLNHHPEPNARQNLLDPTHFVATRNISAFEEVYLEYAKASNLEFLIRYGFEVPGNVYGGRQFEITGEELQNECPSVVLRHDLKGVVEDMTVDCHRQARYMSWEKQFGKLDDETRVREDLYIYRALGEACQELLSLLDPPPELLAALRQQSERDPADQMSRKLAVEVEREAQLLRHCTTHFTARAQATVPEPLTSGMSPAYVKMLQTYRELHGRGV
jgi:hypothetical protein